MKTVLRLMTPRSPGQWFLWFAAWTSLFNAFFLLVLWVFGQADVMSLWQKLAVGAITCAPFLTAAMMMLRLHLRLQGRLFLSARTDLLTRMPNRRAFIDSVSARLTEEGGTLLMIDVDHFKAVNDTWGHGFGDICLQRIAINIRPVISASFDCARLGGEEFAVMLFDTTPEKVKNVSQIIAAGISIQPPGQRTPIRITCSLGGCHAEPGDHLSDVMSCADRALYQAKDSGRARLVMAGDQQETIAPVATKLAS